MKHTLVFTRPVHSLAPWSFLLAVLTLFISANGNAAVQRSGTVEDHQLESEILTGTRTGVEPRRKFKVYLPPSYQSSGHVYPVVYYCHSIFQTPEKLLEDGKLLSRIEEAWASKSVGEFILVVGDYRTATTGSIYENTEWTGRWIDHTVQELVPYIDRTFRTISRATSRGVVGDMMGGRGALVLALRHPEVFSVVYALNPVGTGTGLLPVQSYPNWIKILQAKSTADLNGEHISQIFVTMSQAFLPNPQRPPFYCDFLMEIENGQPVYQPEKARQQIAGFSLIRLLEECGGNASKLRGLAFDWARYDPIQDHVYAAAAFSRALETYGVEHEAEEYRGVYWDENWKPNGRFYSRTLPFLARHLDFKR